LEFGVDPSTFRVDISRRELFFAAVCNYTAKRIIAISARGARDTDVNANV